MKIDKERENCGELNKWQSSCSIWKSIVKRLLRVIEITMLLIQIACLLWTGSLFLHEKKTYSFPYQRLEPDNAIEINDFMEMDGYYVDNSMDYIDSMIAIPGFRLPRGTYLISIQYRTGGEG